MKSIKIQPNTIDFYPTKVILIVHFVCRRRLWALVLHSHQLVRYKLWVIIIDQFLVFNMAIANSNGDRGYKMRLAGSLLAHTLLLTPTLLKIAAELCEKLNVNPFHIDEYHIPKPSSWEYVWSISLIFVLYGVYALARNNVYKLAIFIVGNILFGVMPVVIAVFSHHHDQLFSYHGNPFDFYWYAYSLIALAIHCLALVFAAALRTSWKASLLAAATAAAQKRQ